MTYEVLARKWRPQQFCEMVGQEHITRTLMNAIKQNRVGHAYLFVGPRGTGKTTSARIFAKALNCENPLENGEPCCKCQNCNEITSGNSMDVQEIDGASNNKVENIRDLRGGIYYTPTRSNYRIYIIDEVHMLTASAWNALLKTLEEPPPHVKFLFATTEPHKVLATIISRCQRFDLKPIPVPTIVQQLRKIIKPENIFIDEEALVAIARAADGGMRDAQSILDQIIAFCDGNNENQPITEKDVIDVFGLTSSQELQNLVCSIIGNNQEALFNSIQNLADKGRDLEHLYEDLANYIRNLMICSVIAKPQNIVQVSDNEIVNLKTIAAMTKPTILQRILQGLMDNSSGIKSSINKRIYLEATLCRITYEAHALQIDDLIAQINYLRQQENIPEVKLQPPAPPAQIIINNYQQTIANDNIQIKEVPVTEEPISIAPEPQEIIKEQDEIVNYEEEIVVESNAQEIIAPIEEIIEPQVEKVAPIEEIIEPQVEKVAPIEEIISEVMNNKPPIIEEIVSAEIFDPTESFETAIDDEINNDIETESNKTKNNEFDFSNMINTAIKNWEKIITLLESKDINPMFKIAYQQLTPLSMINNMLNLGFDFELKDDLVAVFSEAEFVELLNKTLQQVTQNPNNNIQIKRQLIEKKTIRSTPELFKKMEENESVQQVIQFFQGELIDVKGY